MEVRKKSMRRRQTGGRMHSECPAKMLVTRWRRATPAFRTRTCCVPTELFFKPDVRKIFFFNREGGGRGSRDGEVQQLEDCNAVALDISRGPWRESKLRDGFRGTRTPRLLQIQRRTEEGDHCLFWQDSP